MRNQVSTCSFYKRNAWEVLRVVCFSRLFFSDKEGERQTRLFLSPVFSGREEEPEYKIVLAGFCFGFPVLGLFHVIGRVVMAAEVWGDLLPATVVVGGTVVVLKGNVVVGGTVVVGGAVVVVVLLGGASVVSA